MEILFEHFNFSSELAKQRALFDECFPENIGTTVQTAGHYSWKFRSGPFTPNSYEYVARTSDGEMIGYYAAIPYPYSIGGETTPAGMVCDVMTGVKARGKGVFTRLGSYSTDQLGLAGIPFTTGYPIRDEVIPGHLKVGWKIAFKLPLYIKFLKVNRISFLKKIPLLPSLINLLLALLYLPGKITGIKYQVRIFDQLQLDSITGYEEFLNSWYKEVPNHLLKTKKFLKWRLGAPGKTYKIVTIENDGEIKAMAVTAFVVKEGVPSLAILDLMTTRASQKFIKPMHIELEKLAKELKAETILMMISRNGSKRNKLPINGFIRSPFTFSLIIKKLSEKFTDEQLYNAENWNLMWIDSDDL